MSGGHENERICGYGGGALVLAALGGAVVGAAVALLLAPKSGQDTRRQFTGYVDSAREVAGRVPEAIKSAAHAAQETMMHETAAPTHGKSK